MSSVRLDLQPYHVVRAADRIEVVLADGRVAEAAVVGSDPDTDLAVLRAALDDPPTIRLGDSNRARVGDIVLAIGNPVGVGQTVTQTALDAPTGEPGHPRSSSRAGRGGHGTNALVRRT